MKTLLIAVASAALVAGTAQAATVVDESDFRSSSSEFERLSFDGYQGSGSVVQVDVTFLAEIGGTIDVTNDSGQNQNFSAGFGIISEFYPTTDTSFSSRLSVAGNTSGTIEANESLSVELFDSDVESFTFVGADITQFLSPFDVFIVSLSDVGSFGSDPDVDFSISFGGSASAQVAYRVAPVPLPSALPMLLAGIGGFSYFARRRQLGAKPEKT